MPPLHTQSQSDDISLQIKGDVQKKSDFSAKSALKMTVFKYGLTMCPLKRGRKRLSDLFLVLYKKEQPDKYQNYTRNSCWPR
jgi:hypothetical protein